MMDKAFSKWFTEHHSLKKTRHMPPTSSLASTPVSDSAMLAPILQTLTSPPLRMLTLVSMTQKTLTKYIVPEYHVYKAHLQVLQATFQNMTDLSPKYCLKLASELQEMQNKITPKCDRDLDNPLTRLRKWTRTRLDSDDE